MMRNLLRYLSPLHWLGVWVARPLTPTDIKCAAIAADIDMDRRLAKALQEWSNS